MEELNQVQENLETTKPKKKIKTSEEIKQELINKKKEIEKKLKEIELKEAEKKLKPLFNLFIKNAQKLSNEDVARMVAHYKIKFAEKKEENK